MDSITAWIASLTFIKVMVVFGGLAGLYTTFFGTKREEYYTWAGVLWVFAVAVFMKSFNDSRQEVILDYIVILGAIVGGRMLWKQAVSFYEIEKEELDAETEAERSANLLHIEQTRGQEIHIESNKRVSLLHSQLDTEIKSENIKQLSLNTTQGQLELEDTLIETGKQQGLRPQDVADVHKEQVMSNIKVEEGWKTAVAALKAGDILDTADVQVIKKLTQDLADEVRARQNIIDGNDAPDVKRILIARHDKNIQNLEARIDERQGLALPPHRQEALGSGEESTDLGRYSEPEAEADQEQIPRKRRRGRPRKNPAD
jgi:hypothetical protein